MSTHALTMLSSLRCKRTRHLRGPRGCVGPNPSARSNTVATVAIAAEGSIAERQDDVARVSAVMHAEPGQSLHCPAVATCCEMMCGMTTLQCVFRRLFGAICLLWLVSVWALHAVRIGFVFFPAPRGLPSLEAAVLLVFRFIQYLCRNWASSVVYISHSTGL